jgi:hypothetical protein
VRCHRARLVGPIIALDAERLGLAGLLQCDEERGIVAERQAQRHLREFRAVGLALETRGLDLHACIGGLFLDLLRLRVDIAGR